MTKLLSAKVLGVIIMLAAIGMAVVHWTVTNLQSVALWFSWSEALTNWIAAMGGTLNAIITASSFISGLTAQTQWIIAWIVIIGFFLVGLMMLWKPRLAAVLAAVLLGFELYVQLTTFNSVILAFGYSVAGYTGTTIWDFVTLPYVADVNFILLATIAGTAALLISACYVVSKSWHYDWW